jgi:hypothetical protein
VDNEQGANVIHCTSELTTEIEIEIPAHETRVRPEWRDTCLSLEVEYNYTPGSPAVIRMDPDDSYAGDPYEVECTGWRLTDPKGKPWIWATLVGAEREYINALAEKAVEDMDEQEIWEALPEPDWDSMRGGHDDY